MLHEEDVLVPTISEDEATKPGPGEEADQNGANDGIVIISHNVDGFLARAAATHHQATLYAWQETDITADCADIAKNTAKQYGYELHTGRTSRTLASSSPGSCGEASNDSDTVWNSRVAVACAKGLGAFSVAHLDHETVALAQSGRWVERIVPIASGEAYIIVASFYGIAGASWDPVQPSATGTAVNQFGSAPSPRPAETRRNYFWSEP